MRRSNPETPHSQSIDMSQWHQDINTFVDEMRGELEQIIDELSNTFSPVDKFGVAHPQRDNADGNSPQQRNPN